MKKYYPTPLLCLLLTFHYPLETIDAAQGHLPAGSRQAGMGRASVALTGFWSCHNNQAGLALVNQISTGIYYESRFLLNQLSSKCIGIVVPTGTGVLGATFFHFGYALYHEMKTGITYARSFSPYFRIGCQLDYIRIGFGDQYGYRDCITFELGIQSDLSGKLSVGAWICNPVELRLTDYPGDKLPAILRTGIKWQVSEGLVVCIEAEKSSRLQPVFLRAGIEYALKETFFFRGGFTTTDEIFSMGFGFTIGAMQFDISSIMHESLGFSPQASLTFQF